MRTLMLAVLLAGCTATNPTDAADAAAADGPTMDAGVAEDLGSTFAVTFRYHPDWPGATGVEVLGGFGAATDWAQPIATLQPDGAGGFAGTVTLAAGTYLYLFRVTGDGAAAMPAAYRRYVVDPLEPGFAACPAQAPTYSMKQANPCSRLTVPEGPPATPQPVMGTVTLDGAPAAGWLAVIERDEPMSHHFFVDRTDSKADGTFSFSLAPGRYRMQVQHPSYLAKTDAERAAQLGVASRRALSSTFTVAAATTLAPAEVAYHGYAQLQPRDVDGGVPLPATFDFTVVQGAIKARLTVYGTAMGGKAPEIGDPWFASPPGTATRVVFDGGFNTMQAEEPSAVPGERYFWGTEQLAAGPDAGVSWTRQSMVVPITFR